MKFDARKVNIAAIGLFLLFLYLPLAQAIFQVFPETQLNGITKIISRPNLRPSAWFDGSLQAELEAWFNEKVGFRGLAIKTDNQLNFFLFREIHQKTFNKIIVGKNNYLFENSYIKSYNGQDHVPEEEITKRVAKLKELQDILAEKNIALVFLISPSKATFYPEYLPKAMVDLNADVNPRTNYEQIIPILTQNQINLINARDLFLKQKSVTRYPLFTKSGTHWTRYGSCRISGSLIDEISRQLKSDFLFPDCNDVSLRAAPVEEDKDLADLTNLWNSKIFYEELAYPNFKSTATKPNNINLLLIGDSFSWGLLKNLKNAGAIYNYDFFYYFNTHFKPDGSSETIDKNPVALKSFIEMHNALVIEANESALSDMGFGFIEAALNALKNQ